MLANNTSSLGVGRLPGCNRKDYIKVFMESVGAKVNWRDD